MLQKISIFIAIFTLVAVAASTESSYRKYLRTRPPRLSGEVHVEEVLEVFRTDSRPSQYGVYNQEVNAFLANDYLQKRRRTTTPGTTMPTTTTTTTTAASVLSTSAPATVRPTYPVPNGDNRNPDYTELFRPSISMTKYPNYKPMKTIIIQEAGENVDRKNVEPSVRLASVAEPSQGEDYQYSNEEDYLEP